MRNFKEYFKLREANKNDIRSEDIRPLEKGFMPPKNLRPIIDAFLNSGKIEYDKNVDGEQKPPSMGKKPLYLVGGPVRDFVASLFTDKKRTIKDYDLATPATPAQIGTILSAAGFKYSGDRSGQGGEDLKYLKHFYIDGEPVEAEMAQKGDSKTWYVKGRDNSPARKPFVIGAVVNGEDFDVATFRNDTEVVDGSATVDFTSSITKDAERRDLTINSMYIELTSSDSENKKLYDPTGKGLNDLRSGKISTVGKAEHRFEEDPLRIMRLIRFHARFGNGTTIEPEARKAIKKFLNLNERIPLERIREEFLKGLLHPDVDPKKYLEMYKNTKLINVVFPGIRLSAPNGIPAEFTDKKDKSLALAWLLRYNTVDEVREMISSYREVGGEQKPTGWQNQEVRDIMFLLELKEFHPENLSEFLNKRKRVSLSNEQIKEWVEMFNIPGTQRNSKGSQWAKAVNKFSTFRPYSFADLEASGRHVGPMGFPLEGPEIGKALDSFNREKFGGA